MNPRKPNVGLRYSVKTSTFCSQGSDFHLEESSVTVYSTGKIIALSIDFILSNEPVAYRVQIWYKN